MDLERIARILKDHCQLEPGRLVLVGVSGGPDSLALLHALLELGYPVAAAHLDHGLRPESREDAVTVEQMLAAWHVSVATERQDVSGYARRERVPVEEAARTVRYRFLFHQARLLDAQAVTVGHTADDQVETVLMHFLRGSGLNGLQGMAYCQRPTPWDPEIPLVRPLLDTWRSEVLAFCAARNLSPLEDQSNNDTRLLRNRLRGKLIPTLARDYNPKVKTAIWRLARNLQSDFDLVRRATEIAWSAVVTEEEGSYIQIDGARLRHLAPALQRNLVKLALERLATGGSGELTYEGIETALQFLSESNKSETRLPGGFNLVRAEGAVLLIRRDADDWLRRYPQIRHPQELIAGRALPLENSWWLTAERIALEQPPTPESLKTSSFTALVDARKLTQPLLVRPPKPGDRFSPYGLEGHSIKVSDWFINEKLPRQARKHYPLVCSGGQIIWIPGYRIAHTFQVSVETRSMLLLQMHTPAQGT